MLCFAVIPVGDGRPIADRRVLNWRAALAAGRGLTLFTLLLLFDDVLVTFWCWAQATAAAAAARNVLLLLYVLALLSNVQGQGQGSRRGEREETAAAASVGGATVANVFYTTN